MHELQLKVVDAARSRHLPAAHHGNADEEAEEGRNACDGAVGGVAHEHEGDAAAEGRGDGADHEARNGHRAASEVVVDHGSPTALPEQRNDLQHRQRDKCRRAWGSCAREAVKPAAPKKLPVVAHLAAGVCVLAARQRGINEGPFIEVFRQLRDTAAARGTVGSPVTDEPTRKRGAQPKTTRADEQRGVIRRSSAMCHSPSDADCAGGKEGSGDGALAAARTPLRRTRHRLQCTQDARDQACEGDGAEVGDKGPVEGATDDGRHVSEHPPVLQQQEERGRGRGRHRHG